MRQTWSQSSWRHKRPRFTEIRSVTHDRVDTLSIQIVAQYKVYNVNMIIKKMSYVLVFESSYPSNYVQHWIPDNDTIDI